MIHSETASELGLMAAVIAGLYAAHQDFWWWRTARPLVFGFLPIGLAYHAVYCMAAALLMWVTTLSELSATIVIYYGGMSTMPIEIFQQVDSGLLALASAYSVILLAAIFAPLAAARWLFGLRLGALG